MTITRRQTFAGAFCLCCLPTRLLAGAPTELQQIAPGIHIRRGVDQEADKSNEDSIANIGLIEGRDGLLVTDTGGSLADGESLRAAIKSLSSKPIRYVLLSHIHPDHIFGAGAFVADHPVFIGHANLPQSMAARGPFYQTQLDAILGPGKSGPIVRPTLTVATTREIDLGNRRLTLTAHKQAHTSSDVSLFDHETGTLLPADLLFVGRMPSLDGNLKGWLETFPELAALNSARAVPGHGPISVDFTTASAPLRNYLTLLRDETRAAIAANKDIATASVTVAQSEKSKWKLFDDYNGRNVTEAYKELEWE